MTTRWRFLAAVLLSLLAIVSTACAPVIRALPQIVSVITDASATIQLIDSAVSAWFARHPDVKPEVRDQYRAAYERCLIALNVANHAAAGAGALDQQEVDAAFAEFRAAYLALRDLLVLERVATVAPDGRLSVDDGADLIVLPEPVALRLQVVRQ